MSYKSETGSVLLIQHPVVLFRYSPLCDLQQTTLTLRLALLHEKLLTAGAKGLSKTSRSREYGIQSTEV
jgi:hypothetical protein